MRIRFMAALLVVAMTATVSTPSIAAAQLANGSTGNFSYRFPDLSTSVFGPSGFTVGSGVELSAVSVGNILWSIDLDADAQTMTITANDPGCCTTAASFSGWLVQFDQPIFGAGGVATLMQTDIVNFSGSRVSSTANTVAVEFGGGLNLQNQRSVVIQFTAATVPEPASVGLLAAGLLGLGLSTRGRFRR